MHQLQVLDDDAGLGDVALAVHQQRESESPDEGALGHQVVVNSLLVLALSETDQHGSHRRVLIRMTCGADTMVAVGDDEWPTLREVALNHNDGRDGLALVNPLQVFSHMLLMHAQEGQIARSKQVLGDVFDTRGTPRLGD
jgi:hypothetical protein